MVIKTLYMAVSLRIELSLRVLEARVLPLHYETIWSAMEESNFRPERPRLVNYLCSNSWMVAESGNWTPANTVTGCRAETTTLYSENGGGRETRTLTLSHRFLRPTCIPISPLPQNVIVLYNAVIYTLTVG